MRRSPDNWHWRFHVAAIPRLDGELNLPPEQYSHGLKERVATSVAFNGYNQILDIINKTTAAKVTKRQVEELALSSSCDFDEFYQAQQAQYKLGEKTGDILVISVDGKGVVMRQEDLRPDTKKRAPTPRKELPVKKSYKNV